MTIGFLGTDLSWWGCEDSLQTERVAPAQHKSVEKEKIPGVGDWLPSDGKVSQECLGCEIVLVGSFVSLTKSL